MEKIKLTDICNPKQWKTIPTSELLEDGYPVYGANGIIGYYSEFNHKNPVIAVTCRGATCGTINITVPKSYVTGNAMCLDDVRSDIYMEYLYYCLKHYNFNNVISGSAQPQITRQGMEKIYVTIGSHNEQMYIVDKLKRVENVIDLRKRELKQLDTLVKSRFVEMFGDPILNDKNWKLTNMKAVCLKITDGEHGSVPRTLNGHPFLNAKHIKPDGWIDWKNVTYTSSEVHEKIYKRCNPQVNDILMTTTGTIGNIAIVPEREPFSMDRGITLLKLNSQKVNPIFIAWLLRFDSMQNIMKANVHASAIGHLFLNKVEKLPVILVDIELQNQFADFVASIDKSKSKIQKSLEETQLLFDSLMQKYFG